MLAGMIECICVARDITVIQSGSHDVSRAFIGFIFRVLRCLRVAFVAVAAQARHPTNVLVAVVASHHVHDLAGVPLRVLVLELGVESLVGSAQERIRQFVLLGRREGLGAWEAPRLTRIELCCVFVGAQVHAERELILRELPRLDQVMMIVAVANEVDVKIGGRCHGLPGAAALHHTLELRPGGLDLTARVLWFVQCLVRIGLLEVIVAGQNCPALLAEVGPLERRSVLD